MEDVAASTTFLFPPELERPIFEIAALSDPKTAVCLLGVSRAIHEWIGPLIYCTLTHNPPTLSAHKKYPTFAWYQRYGKFVRHLLLSLAGGGGIIPFLACCPHLEDLAIWGPESPVDMDGVVDALTELKARSTSSHLTRLSVTLSSLFADAHHKAVGTYQLNDGHGVPASTSPFYFSPALGQHPLLEHMVHLELLDPCDSWEPYSGLAFMPNLTHLCVSKWSGRPFVVGVLEDCRSLKALILVEALILAWDETEVVDGETCKLVDQDQIERVFQEYEGEVGIERIVVMRVKYLDNWTKTAMGSMSMWTLADEALEERKQRPNV
ncbi:hypothetical protein BDN72DRAFT_849326 [Pluteus cervinus]|uniref:Uncharacterized protein n=1 Tax=Pluteus cervinus TaxID=181527 RepID=A0ACD3A7K6_9AGAR|nr:hypothetical protein BDN72DRAFT_849326 [Pluteus cervinus]